MVPPPQRIVCLYKKWQHLYDVIGKTMFPRVEFRRGIPMDLDSDDFLWLLDCWYFCIGDDGGGGGYT
jgi:hypothetical protein